MPESGQTAIIDEIIVERIPFLSGNEAIARGAVRAGLGFACGYPGTPSTEVVEELARLKGPVVEWCVNEKVALETGIGASLAGARTLVTMKHVGLNVAADPFMTLALTGVNAGLVVLSADDPGMHSSQNEQDNRHFAAFAKVPMLEPSDSQEAYDFVASAFDLSEEFDTPVLLRCTTRVSHGRGRVVPGPRWRGRVACRACTPSATAPISRSASECLFGFSMISFSSLSTSATCSTTWKSCCCVASRTGW